MQIGLHALHIKVKVSLYIVNIMFSLGLFLFSDPTVVHILVFSVHENQVMTQLLSIYLFLVYMRIRLCIIAGHLETT